MLTRLFRQSTQTARVSQVLTSRPQLEELEARDCPAAPSISSLTALELDSNMVHLSGRVSDEAVGTVTVDFGGVASGSVTVAPDGSFDYVAMVWTLGEITATARDNENLTSNTAQVNFTSAIPSLTMHHSWAAAQFVRLTGYVTDEFPAERTVTFGGVVSGSTTTDANGYYDVTLFVSSLGEITATVEDQWCQQSQQASIMLTNTAPEIRDFIGTLLSGTTWRFTGRVIDEYAANLTVRFSGLPSACRVTATTQADGTFSVDITFYSGETGPVYADVCDMWGVDAEQACFYVV